MILDGWEGDQWALGICQLLDVKKKQLSLQNFFLSQNPGVLSAWHPNHCFSTIQVHLAHPQKMILDGWERDPLVQSLASNWYWAAAGCQNNCACKISFSSQNPGVQSAWHPNHCFSTIKVHLAHPQNDFGWLGRGSIHRL
jgi:hypothetical protein